MGATMIQPKILPVVSTYAIKGINSEETDSLSIRTSYSEYIALVVICSDSGSAHVIEKSLHSSTNPRARGEVHLQWPWVSSNPIIAQFRRHRRR
jgi:hypothetical protein